MTSFKVGSKSVDKNLLKDYKSKNFFKMIKT